MDDMQAPILRIRKKILTIQGKVRPCVQVQAYVDPRLQSTLVEHFGNEPLFKKSMYAGGLPEGATPPTASLAPMLAGFLKNDACPEISVKTLLAGQMHQASGAWEMLSFEFIAKRAFDSLVELATCVSELGTETYYAPSGADAAMHAADIAAEKRLAIELEIGVQRANGLADAA